MEGDIDDDIEREIVLLIPPLRRYTITVKILSNSTLTIEPPPPPPSNETWMERAQRELLATVEGDGNQYMVCHTLDGKSDLVMTRRGNEEYHG